MMMMDPRSLASLPRTASSLPFLLVLSLSLVASCSGQNSGDKGYLDRFTYRDDDVDRGDGFFDYTPENWDQISCNEGSRLDECLGYRDKWETGRGWKIEENQCRWCPDGSDRCGRHRQSPINLRREVGFEPGTHENANECIDVHWMKYEDSYCDLQQLVDADAFTIERHALRITQPVTVFEDFDDDNDGIRDGVRSDCRLEGSGSRFGRIDFSKGFSHYWFLSHIDVHVPSEHYQDGARYDGEIHLQHFYSEDTSVQNNDMGTVAVFLQAYDDAPPYLALDKIICQWRRKEYEVRTECGLDPVDSTYPGCFPLKRNLRESASTSSSSSSSSPATDRPKNSTLPRFRTAQDVILYNAQRRNHPNHTNVKIRLEESDRAPVDEEKDWDAWIQQHSDQMREEEELYHRLRKDEHGGEHTEALHQQFRQLLAYDEVEWFNYWPMLGVRTEYYFRYSGGQSIPPCYGKFNDDAADGENTRSDTNHWRVMKDPTRISRRQLKELQRLIAERIAPMDDPVNSCEPDTAAKVSRNDDGAIIDVDVARPLMEWNTVHFKTFCECKDWPSKWPEDRAWCLEEDIEKRFYEKPYNFESDEPRLDPDN